MKNIMIAINYSEYLSSDSGIKYNVKFPFSIETEQWSIDLIIEPYYPLDDKLDNSKLQKKLLLIVIEELKIIFTKRSNINIFEGLTCFPEAESIQSVLNDDTKDYFKFSVQIKDELFINLTKQFNELENLEKTYERTKYFLSDVTNWQLENEKDSIITCFRFLFDCFNLSFDKVDCISDLDEIKHSFLDAANVSSIENSKMKLFRLSSPKLYKSKT